MTVSHSDEPTSPPTRPPDAEVGERPAVDVPPAQASAGHGSPLSGFAALVMAVLRLGQDVELFSPVVAVAMADEAQLLED